MNIIDLFFLRRIEGMSLDALTDTLSTRSAPVKITRCEGGIIVLSNNKILRCVVNYYRRSEEVKSLKTKGTSKCYYIQNYLFAGTEWSEQRPYDCIRCHTACLNLLRQRKLERILNKKERPICRQQQN